MLTQVGEQRISNLIANLENNYVCNRHFLKSLYAGQECHCFLGAMVDLWAKETGKKIYWERVFTDDGVIAYYLQNSKPLEQAAAWFGFTWANAEYFKELNDVYGKFPIEALKEMLDPAVTL